MTIIEIMAKKQIENFLPQTNEEKYQIIYSYMTELPKDKETHIGQLNEYIIEICKEDSHYGEELIKRLKNDKEFKTKMFLVIQEMTVVFTVSLLVEEIDSNIFSFEMVLDILKEKIKLDYKDMKDFRLRLIDSFEIEQVEASLFCQLNDSVKESCYQKLKIVKEIIENTKLI